MKKKLQKDLPHLHQKNGKGVPIWKKTKQNSKKHQQHIARKQPNTQQKGNEAHQKHITTRQYTTRVERAHSKEAMHNKEVMMLTKKTQQRGDKVHQMHTTMNQ